MSEEKRVVITNTGAIYVDDTRITHRGTKWGLHFVLDDFSCGEGDVVRECIKRGWSEHVPNISEEPYVTQRSAQ